jgi:hypothetical protein
MQKVKKKAFLAYAEGFTKREKKKTLKNATKGRCNPKPRRGLRR